MDAADTTAAVEDATVTELSRLGADKALIAATGATLERDAVLRAAATREAGLADAFEGWAAEADGELADAFDRAATAAAKRRDRLDVGTDESDSLSAHLRTVEGAAERVGAGLVGAPLVADRFYLQVVSFFVNEADGGGADLARELRSGAGNFGPARDALAVLDASEREHARDAAIEAVEVAYEAYADTLEAMGLDPKPVC